MRSAGFAPLSKRATSLSGFTSSRTFFATPHSYFIVSHFGPPPTLRVKLKSHLNSLPLLLALSLHRFMFMFIGRHQFPEQSWQVFSPFLCKSCITLLERCISRHPVPPLFLISTHSNDTYALLVIYHHVTVACVFLTPLPPHLCFVLLAPVE